MSAEVEAVIKRFDHLRNSGVCSPTTRDLLDDAETLLAALSSPPADDVREALAVEAVARAIFSGYVGETPGGFEKQTYSYDREKAEHVARRALAAVAEVRPYGTVTGTERPYSEAVDVELGAWETDDIEERAHDLLAVVAFRRAEGARDARS